MWRPVGRADPKISLASGLPERILRMHMMPQTDRELQGDWRRCPTRRYRGRECS